VTRRIAFVVARDRHGVIGKDGRLPWRLPDDMRRVRALTVGKPLIMGRRTFDSIGRPLPDRVSIVLTRDPAFRCEGCLVARTTDEALALAGDAPEVIVFGGAGVFKDFLPRADRIYLTEVDTEVVCVSRAIGFSGERRKRRTTCPAAKARRARNG